MEISKEPPITGILTLNNIQIEKVENLDWYGMDLSNCLDEPVKSE